MAAQDQKFILPRFPAGAVVLWKADDWNAVAAQLESMRPLAGDNVVLTATPSGTRIDAEAGGGAVEQVCQLGALRAGVITPGWFVGGGLSVVVEPGVIMQVAGRSVWLRVDWSAEEVDQVLQAGGAAGNVVVDYGASVPEDDVPNITQLSGVAYIALGAWDDDLEFVGAGCGNVNLSFCPGGFIKTRG